jgi:hypothetical protein
MKWHVKDKRINAFDRAVFDLYRAMANGFDHHQATIELNGEAPGGIKVLYGALTPEGKKRAWEAVRSYEGLSL